MEALSEASHLGAEMKHGKESDLDLAPETEDIKCFEVKTENGGVDLTTCCYIEIIHNEEDCSVKYVIPQPPYIPRKLFLEGDLIMPEVKDSAHVVYFEITELTTLTDPLACNYRPPNEKLVTYVNDLILRNLSGMKHCISLDYGRFDLEGLRVFQECQLKDDVLNESIWFGMQEYPKPVCRYELDKAAIRKFQDWLLNYGSECTVPLPGKVSLKTNEIADLACERWINSSLINYFISLIHTDIPQTYIVNFAVMVDLDSEVEKIRLHFSTGVCNGQILFLSPIGIHPDCDETFMSQEHILTSHYAFGSFFFCDSKVRYADTMGLKIPWEFIEKVNSILFHFNVEPTYHYCHDPRGTLIEVEPRFISHTCTQYCSRGYPLQTCTNVCGVALLIGLFVAAASKVDFVEMCKPGLHQSKFAYLNNISHYSHYLRLVLMQYVVNSSIDLNVITNSVIEDDHENLAFSNSYRTGAGQINQVRRKNVLNIRSVSDLIQDAVLKYAKSKEKPVMQLICRIKSSGKLVTKSFRCSPLGQDDGACVAAIQSFLNSSGCRDWLLSYVSEGYPNNQVGGENSLIYHKAARLQSSGESTKIIDCLSPNLNSDSYACKDSLSDSVDPEPIRQNRRKNKLDISYVSDLICDAKLKFVKVQGKPALQLGCIIKANGKSVTKTFPCSLRGQDDAKCVTKIQNFMNSDQCVEWIRSYIKVLQSRSFEGKTDNDSMKFSYRKIFLDIKNVYHLVSDARVRFIKSKGKSCVQLLCKIRPSGRLVSKLFPYVLRDRSDTAAPVALVQKFINSNSCETWLHSCLSKNLLDISNISDFVDGARLKYFRIKGNPIVQLICQMKSTRRVVKKTFAFSCSGIGDSESVAEIQKYIDSSDCIVWLDRCKNRVPSSNLPLDISNISDLIDDAKLKFQNVNDKPTMQLTCRLSNKERSVSKSFPCSALGPDDDECIAKIQSFVRSIDCIAWLCKFMVKNQPIYSKYNDCGKPMILLDSRPKNSDPSSVDIKGNPLIQTEQQQQQHLPPFKRELEAEDDDSDGDMLESWVESEPENPALGDDEVNKDSSQNPLAGTSELHDSSRQDKSHEGCDDFLNEVKGLDLGNLADLADDVKFKLTEVNGKLKICVLVRVRYTRKLVKRYIPCSSLTRDPEEILEEVQNFIDSRKCLLWLSRSVSQFSENITLDVKNIVDLVEYASLRYVKSKDNSVIYLMCRIKSNRKLVRKVFQCSDLKSDYMKCINEIQNFVDSSNCRTWLSVYSGKTLNDIEIVRKDEGTMIHLRGTGEIVQSNDILSSMDPVSVLASTPKKFNLRNVSHLVNDVELRHLKVKGKSVHQLVCQLKYAKKAITKCFPCSSLGKPCSLLGENNADCVAEIQKYLNTDECLKWMHKCNEKSAPLLPENARSACKLSSIRNVEGEPEYLQNVESVKIQIQNTERALLDQEVTGTHFKSKMFFDIVNISHIVYNLKLIFIDIKEKPVMQLLCQMKPTGKLVTKAFSCSPLGLDDKECLSRIQNFINSKDSVMWLGSCTDEDPSQNLFDEEPPRISVVGKPEITFVRPSTLRVVCHLNNGRTKCKAFRCTSEGRNDKVTMKAIDEFLTGDSFNEWLLIDRGRDRGGPEWKFFKYIETGLDTKHFVDSIPFDVNQSFILNRKSGYEIMIHRDQQCNKESIVENPLWGTSHRLDDTYSLKNGPLNTSTVAVCLLLSCASKTDECRTECGKLTKDVSIVDNSLSCCGHLLQDYQCTNCYTSTTPQWCRKNKNVLLCKNCDIYLRNHGTDRPPHLWKDSSTTNFKHLKCKWKLKFVLRSDEMSRWLVYRSIHNNQSHNCVIQDRKRPSLNTKDEWYSSKMKGSDYTSKIHSNRKRKRKVHPADITPECNDPQMQGPRNSTLLKAPEDFKQELYPVECPEESVHYMESYEDYVQDGGVITEEETFNYQYDDDDEEEESSSLQSRKSIKFENPAVNEGERVVASDEASMVCIKCIQESAAEIFCCSNKGELDVHISECHREELFACAACYTENNVVVTFPNENAFKDHMKLHVAKRSM